MSEGRRGAIDRKANKTFEEGLRDEIETMRERISGIDGRGGQCLDCFARLTREIWTGSAISACESPIEQLMLAGLLFAGYGYRDTPVEIWPSEWPDIKPSVQVLIIQQHRIGNYRVDFALFARDFSDNEMQIIIECDGHEFHERTKEQAMRDRSRDRKLQSLGYKVFRFTGSEIWKDVSACVAEVELLVSNFIEADLIARGIIRDGEAAA